MYKKRPPEGCPGGPWHAIRTNFLSGRHSAAPKKGSHTYTRARDDLWRENVLKRWTVDRRLELSV